MIYKLRLPLHLQPLRQPQHEQYTRTRKLELRDYEARNTLSKGTLDCPGARNSKVLRGHRNSVAQYHMNSLGALNVKASVKTREHDSRREHCMSEAPGYYFGKRVLLPECSSR